MRLLGWLAAATLILGACSVTVPATAAPVPFEAPGTPGPAASAVASPAAVQVPEFLTIALTDVRSGERFTLGDFKGKVVIVEGVAVW